VSSLNLASTGLLDPSLGLGGLVDLESNLSSQGGEAQTKGTVKFSQALLVAGGSPAGSGHGEFRYEIQLAQECRRAQSLTLNIGSAVAHLNGTYSAAGEATVVNIKLDAKDMPAKDLEAFSAGAGHPSSEGRDASGGHAEQDLNLTGRPTGSLPTGTVGLFNGVLANFDLGSKMSSVASLAGIKSGRT